LCEVIEVLAYNAFRYKQILSIGAVEQKQVFTEAKSSALAIEALLARRRVRNNNSISLGTLGYSGSCSRYYASNFMAKTGGSVAEEQRMTTQVGFYVCPTGSRGGNLQEYFSCPWPGDRSLFQAYIIWRIKHRGEHHHSIFSLALFFSRVYLKNTLER